MPAELQIAFALISTATVVGGFIFAAYQFVAFVRQRRQETALTLMKTTQPPELFSRSIRRIFELPDAAPAEAIHGLGPELEQALIETFVSSRTWATSCIRARSRCTWPTISSAAWSGSHGGSAAGTSGSSVRSRQRRSNGSSGCSTAWSNIPRRRTRASARMFRAKLGSPEDMAR